MCIVYIVMYKYSKYAAHETQKYDSFVTKTNAVAQ